MANFFGDNATLRDSNIPSEKIRTQDQHGRMRVAHDEITFAAELTTSDTLTMMTLPAGAKIYEVDISSDDLGSTGVLDVGWAASSEGGEVADDNGLYAALDVTSAVVRQKIANSLPGYLKRFTEEVAIKIVPSTSTDVATGQTLKLTIWYVVD